MQLLQSQQSSLLVRSPTEGSLKSKSRYEPVKRRVVYKNKQGEIVNPPPQLLQVKSRTVTPAPSESVKTINSQQTPSITTSNPISIFDFLPLDDPLWLEIIPLEIQQDPNFSLERLVTENQEYFINLLGLFMQERQQNKIQELKLSLPYKRQTTYEQEYKQLQNIDSPALFNPKLYESIRSQTSVPFQSQYEAAFKQPKLHTLENFKPRHVKDKSEMLLLTSYRQNFMDWKQCKTERVGVLRNISTGSLPFIGKSNYQDCFRYTYCEPSENQKKTSLGPFAQGSDMIFKESISRVHYPQHSNTDVSPVRKQGSNYQSSLHKGCENQYKTTFKNSFSYKQQPEQMLQDRYWKQKLLQKIMEKRVQ